MQMKGLIFALATIALTGTSSATELKVGHHLWQQFSAMDRATLLAKFPNLELAPPETMGIIQAVQSANRSTAGTNGGAILGGALGGAMYIDRAFNGSGNNYSAVAQLGAAVIGAAIGSSIDKGPQSRFEFNYSIRTLDGEIREFRDVSNQEFTRPIGQCVSLLDFRPLAAISCSNDKVQLLKALSSIGAQSELKLASPAAINIQVKCRVPAVGLMTLERNICSEMEGKEE